ncbi:unnamed protein product [Bodo saltans]|uniref:Radical SAM core domain-containing protein n=1 Tax=Bodo saltans TaxID=75058 RepID=A0A0S4J780_BODSA|nr:unnamed protein product [Bodo saltans]|eukprot:CUG85671.1 unnamed protein product [Bodo saltans]
MSSQCTQIARPMLSEQRRKTLGNMYSLVGTHSAVKLCRWQKSMLRGRGGCYKWTMYGIRSHQCMEATPSMACANKCTFCWRLNTNPTATEWKWDIDDPEKLVEGMVTQHKALVHEAKGMAGVQLEAAAEAMQPKHCALSLVGEPIIYPRINEFLHKLHKEGISTFLVNNGQFPEAIDAVAPVTQLYLSVDGPTREIMKELDRPVFPDFWERFNRSVVGMSKKRFRRVFRLTMVEHINMEDAHVEHYKRIFEEGCPHFIELKMLTPAFSGRKTPLRIKNVPTFDRLVKFAKKLCDATGDGATYHLACAHKHSGCLLLARKEFRIEGKWHTWIDFDRFNSLVLDEEKKHSIDAMDYLLPTPDWALYGAQEDEGFDPQQIRHITTKRKKHLESVSAAADSIPVNNSTS